MGESYDFSGWATKNDLRCSDGRIIRRDAFKTNDGQVVPLVWNHQHNDPLNVLGHALLENRNDGVYAYCTFNDTEAGKNAKELVKHGDVSSLSIWANKLTQQGGDVLHGIIREVSLVLAGANPGAFIDAVLEHGELSDEEAVIYTGESIYLAHEGVAPDSSADSAAESTAESTSDSSSEDSSEELDNNQNEIENTSDIIDEIAEDITNDAIDNAIDTIENSGEDTQEIANDVINIALANEAGEDVDPDVAEKILDVFDSLSSKVQDAICMIIGLNAKNMSFAHSDEEDEDDDETVEDVFNTLTDKQKNVVYALVGQIMADNNPEGGKDMKHNVFENDEMMDDNVLSHSEMEEIFNDAKRYGSLKESCLAHGVEELYHDGAGSTYGIGNIDYLFPDARTINTTPDFIKREDAWVSGVMAAIHHTPFSRIKSIFADITEDEARAKGYIKGNLKKEEVFSLLKRTTTPTTIYKKQKLDRDDVVDITDFDVVAWLKGEMRMMLNEEIARAILVGDGRLSSDDDKINEQNVRPIWTDADLYTIKYDVNVASGASDDAKAKAVIRAAVKARKNYKGSGNPVLYTTEDWLTDMLLLEDTTGRKIYSSENELATALRVSKIVTVPVMEGLKRTVDGKDKPLIGIIVNLSDYNVGADKGGEVNMFDDFDIDYNAQKYLIETRCSGALTKPYSAIALELVEADSAAG